MGRRGAVLLVWSACACLALATPSSAGASARSTADRLVAVLATIIRRDAHEQARSPGAVTVSRKCCGERVLRVHYRARALGSVVADDYVLSLETKHGVVEGVVITEDAREVRHAQQGGETTASWDYGFQIHRFALGRRRGWSFEASSGSVSPPTGPAGGPRIGLASYRACGRPLNGVPRSLRREVLELLASARRHRVHAPKALPLTLCR